MAMSTSLTATEATNATCPCQDVIPQLQTTFECSTSSVDDIVKLAHDSIDAWPKLKNCPRCLHSRLGDLLEKYDSVADALQTMAATSLLQQQHQKKQTNQQTNGSSEHLGTDAAANGSADDTISAATIAALCQSSSMTTPGQDLSRANGGEVPLVYFGGLKLDQGQSSELLRIVCHDFLSQVATILYDIQQTEPSGDSWLEGVIGNVLYKVLNLIEVFGKA